VCKLWKASITKLKQNKRGVNTNNSFWITFVNIVRDRKFKLNISEKYTENDKEIYKEKYTVNKNPLHVSTFLRSINNLSIIRNSVAINLKFCTSKKVQ